MLETRTRPRDERGGRKMDAAAEERKANTGRKCGRRGGAKETERASVNEGNEREEKGKGRRITRGRNRERKVKEKEAEN